MNRLWMTVSLIGIGLAGGAFAYWKYSARQAIVEESATADSSADEAPTTVTVPTDKLASAHVESTPVAAHEVRQTRIVPGRIDYHGLKRVELKSAVEVVVREVLVKPGDPVQAGTRLASLVSSEIGLARADVEKNEAELRISNQSLEWSQEIAGNLDDLLKTLKQMPGPEDVEKQFEGKLLGDHRQAILSSYAKFVLADRMWADVQPLLEKGAIATQVARQRETNRQVAREEYLAVSEQSRFDARQQRERARATRDFNRRLLDVSRQKLQTLLGAFSEVVETDEEAEGADLTRFYLIAPFAGTVEERFVAEAQRLAAGSPAFIVANTDVLWVTADIRERDWQALTLKAGDAVSVRIPALANREVEAQVDYIGRAVESQTRAVPLIAVLDNADHKFKPGMFVWVSLPAGKSRESLAVPPAALLTHDGHEFVFVEEAPNTYRRVDVKVGARTQDWVAIDGGLALEQRVVTRGAFLLKSELLLEREEE